MVRNIVCSPHSQKHRIVGKTDDADIFVTTKYIYDDPPSWGFNSEMVRTVKRKN